MESRRLERHVDRARAVVESAPPRSRAETRTLLVDPLLDAMGWDVRSASCATDVVVADVELEYLLLVGETATPAMYVAVEPADGSLRTGREDDLSRAMATTGVDRAIYTNGRRLRLLAGITGSDRESVRVDELSDYEPLVHYSRAQLADRLDRHDRRLAARRLAVDRDALATSMVDELASTAGGPHRSEIYRHVTACIDGLVEALASGGDNAVAGGRVEGAPADGGAGAADRSGGVSPVDGAGVGSNRGVNEGGHTDTVESDTGTDITGVADQQTDANRAAAAPDVSEDNADRAGPGDRSAATADRSPPAIVEPGSDAEGEFVVRFFNERGSIGAVGHSTSADALVQAVEYCFERGLSGVRYPWPDDGDGETVLNDQPVQADGSPMDAYHRLDNGRYLNTAGTVSDRAARVEALASRAGLRVMLTGDWEES